MRGCYGGGGRQPAAARRSARHGAGRAVRHDLGVQTPRERLEVTTLVALFVGYACTYFHRADLATLAAMLEREPGRAALRQALPDIASLGMAVYACGKVVGGMLADRFGGRRLFLLALLGATVAEGLAMACTQPGTFAACRAGGMLVLGCAWPALGHVAASTSPRAHLATAMAFLSQSYLLGDAAVRAVLAGVVGGGGDSVAVLRTSTIGLASATVVVASLLWWRRERAERIGARARPFGHGASITAWLVCLAATNALLALVREALSLWGPRLLVDVAAMPAADAVAASAVLQIASGEAALVAGRLADRSARSLVLVTFWPAVVGVTGLGSLAVGFAVGPVSMVCVLALTSAALAMPMTLTSGVLALRGRRGTPTDGGATRLGLVDGAGSAGAVLAGAGFGRIAAGAGPPAMFAALAGVAIAAAVGLLLVIRLGQPPGSGGGDRD